MGRHHIEDCDDPESSKTAKQICMEQGARPPDPRPETGRLMTDAVRRQVATDKRAKEKIPR
jgi:hypothetical protein